MGFPTIWTLLEHPRFIIQVYLPRQIGCPCKNGSTVWCANLWLSTGRLVCALPFFFFFLERLRKRTRFCTGCTKSGGVGGGPFPSWLLLCSSSSYKYSIIPLPPSREWQVVYAPIRIVACSPPNQLKNCRLLTEACTKWPVFVYKVN